MASMRSCGPTTPPPKQKEQQEQNQRRLEGHQT
jgi:hypothetical protein